MVGRDWGRLPAIAELLNPARVGAGFTGSSTSWQSGHAS